MTPGNLHSCHKPARRNFHNRRNRRRKRHRWLMWAQEFDRFLWHLLNMRIVLQSTKWASYPNRLHKNPPKNHRFQYSHTKMGPNYYNGIYKLYILCMYLSHFQPDRCRGWFLVRRLSPVLQSLATSWVQPQKRASAQCDKPYRSHPMQDLSKLNPNSHSGIPRCNHRHRHSKDRVPHNVSIGIGRGHDQNKVGHRPHFRHKPQDKRLRYKHHSTQSLPYLRKCIDFHPKSWGYCPMCHIENHKTHFRDNNNYRRGHLKHKPGLHNNHHPFHKVPPSHQDSSKPGWPQKPQHKSGLLKLCQKNEQPLI